MALDWPADQPILAGGALVLRPWLGSDADAVYEACQDPAIQRWTRVPVPYLREHAEAFAGELAAAQWATRQGAVFAVTDAGRDLALLGACGLVTVDEADLVAEAGYWVAPWARGRGVARRALGVLSAWALGDGGMERLELYIEPDNGASLAVAARSGYQREGVLRAKSLHRGARRDLAVYARLK